MFITGIVLYEAMASARFCRNLTSGREIVAILLFGTVLCLAYLMDVRPELFWKAPGWHIGGVPLEGVPGYQGPYKVLLLSVGGFWWVAYTLAFDGRLSRLFLWSPLRYLGNMSYSYYLIHGVTLQIVLLGWRTLWPIPNRGVGFFGAALLVAFAATWLSGTCLFVAVEKRFSLRSAGPKAK